MPHYKHHYCLFSSSFFAVVPSSSLLLLLHVLLAFLAFSATQLNNTTINNDSSTTTAILFHHHPHQQLQQQPPAPEQCKEAQEWPLNGRTLVRDYRGRVLLMTFVSVNNCENDAECLLALSRLDSLHDQFPAVRVLAIAPDQQPPADVRAFAWRFPRIRFEHEHKTCPVWSWFRAAHLDQFIFDRCSRHTAKLPATGPHTPPPFASTLAALQRTLGAKPCGWCEYNWAKPAPEWPSLHPPVVPMQQQQQKYLMAQQQQQQQQLMKKQQQQKVPTLVVVNKSGLLQAFGTEVGSLKDRSGAGAHKQLAFVERQRPVGSNHHHYQAQNGHKKTKSKYQQQLPYGQQQQKQEASAGSSTNGKTSSQPASGQTPLNGWQQQQQGGAEDERARWEQERARLVREREQLLRERKQQEEERQRQWWAEQQKQREQQQQQQMPETATIAIAQQQPQQEQILPQQEPTRTHQQPVQLQAATEAGWLQQEHTAGVRYANDPYGDPYQFGLGQSRRRWQQQQVRQRRPPQSATTAQQPAQSPQIHPALPVMQQHHQQQQILPAATQSSTMGKNAVNGKKNGGAADPAPLYPEGSETGDYYGYEDEWTTDAPMPLLQIPKPMLQPVAPTMPSIPHDFGFELPCAGFSDESCYQQQTQLRPSEVHRCCRGRILFTDQCVQGKCSNLTTQLCCIQRFLQAKLTCCSDERQGETRAGDHFSHCCFDHFVDCDPPDPCCPRDYAAEQWRSVHELCLPNVEMDLSNVRVPVPLLGTSLVTEYDFGKTDKWHFECHYGGHVQQYSYFEKSASEEDDEGGGGGGRDGGGEIDV